MEVEAGSPYREILGSRYHDLAPNVRLALEDPVCGRGLATVWGASNRVGSWLARRLGLPQEAVHVDLSILVLWSTLGIQWIRSFEGLQMVTYQERRGKYLVETMGHVSVWFDLAVEDGAVVYREVVTRYRGVRLPRALSPRISARAWQDGSGWSVEVDVRAPILGRLSRYKAQLEFI